MLAVFLALAVAADVDRAAVYAANLERYAARNAAEGPLGARFGPGPESYSDPAELRAQRTCFTPSSHTPVRVGRLAATELPERVDWREHGAVAPVQQQHPFGTCWAMAATAVLEGIAVVQAGKPLTKLAEQQMVSCEPADNAGKDGDVTWAWLKEHTHGSLTAEALYPYNRTCNFFREQLLAPDGTRDGYTQACDLPAQPPDGPCPPCPGVSRSDGAPQCRTLETRSDALVSGWGFVKSAATGNDDAIVAALARYGPGTLGIDASCLSGYKHGIVRSCSTQEVDHAVTLVGAGSEDGVPYWLVKNSWGTEFGEEGYFRVERNKGLLGIHGALFACYAPGCSVSVGEEAQVVV